MYASQTATFRLSEESEIEQGNKQILYISRFLPCIYDHVPNEENWDGECMRWELIIPLKRYCGYWIQHLTDRVYNLKTKANTRQRGIKHQCYSKRALLVLMLKIQRVEYTMKHEKWNGGT